MLEIGKWTDTDYFFVSSVGTAIEPRNLLRDYKKILASTNPINTTCPGCHKPFSGTQPPPVIERDGQVLFAHSKCIVPSDTPTIALPTTLSLHDLRHACATFLALNRVHPRVAMEILGHAQIKTTQEIYTHVLDESKVEAIDKMGAMLTLPEGDQVVDVVPLRKQRKRS
jgi:integrase